MNENKRDIENLKDDLRDGADELKHRVGAAGEQAKRDVAGKDMTLGEKIGSHLNEAGHNVKADVDRASREARNEGE